MKYWTSTELLDLRALAAAGLKDTAIARRLGRTVKAVYRMRERLGVWKRNDVIRGRVVRLARLGWSDPEIAAAVGRSRGRVQQIRAAAGIGPAVPGKAREQRTAA